MVSSNEYLQEYKNFERWKIIITRSLIIVSAEQLKSMDWMNKQRFWNYIKREHYSSFGENKNCWKSFIYHHLSRITNFFTDTMKFATLFAASVAISAANATFLPGLLGGSSGGYGSSSGGSTVETSCGGSGSGSGSCGSTSEQSCEQPCEQPCDTTGGSAGGSTSTQEEVPTDIKSQIIGAISQMLETTFSGSGAMLSNLIG